MNPLRDNGAVSAMFRVFGGAGRPLQGDDVKRFTSVGTHAGEVWVLGTLVPAVFSAAVFERLVAWLGWGWAFALWLPAVFFGIQIIGTAIGLLTRLTARIGGNRETWQWAAWSVVLSAWSIWAWEVGGWVRWVAGIWFLAASIELLSLLFLAWQRLMRVAGRRGIVLRIVLAVLVHLPLVPLLISGNWTWAVGWMLLTGLGWCRATLAPNARGFGPVVSRCEGSGVWLTIDDGPDPQTTPALLELLDEFDAKATFFVVGENVNAHPELAREIVARGHRLANHTWTHPAATFWCAGPARTRREILDGARAIERATGIRPRWFRAPVGHANYFTHPVVFAAGMEVVGWTRTGRDGVFRDVPAILARLTRCLQRGDIVIVHEATPVAVEVLEGLLRHMQENHLETTFPEEPT